MSVPWKKSKSGRIARFMSEFQQSPKRGGSLVVETGFPTSLIDLFVKNRDRLKKSSSKRLKRQTQTAPNASSPINPDVAVKHTKRETVQNQIKNEKIHFVDNELTAENNPAVDKKRCVCACGVGGNGVLMAFKVFIVALLALSTKKKLTVGITLSTLALLLTEFVAARMFTRSKLYKTDTQKDKPAVSIQSENVISGEKNKTFDDSGEETKSISCLEETEPLAVTEKPSSKVLTIRDLLLKEDKSKSKTSRLKSKIVKKLKSYSKTKKNKKETIVIKEESLSEVSSLVSEEKPEIVESEREEKESNPTLMRSKGVNTNGVVVIVIVLTGLLSGKIFAIVLTLSCLFLRFEAAKRSGRCI